MNNKRLKRFQKIANWFHKFGTQEKKISLFKLGVCCLSFALVFLGTGIGSIAFTTVFAILSMISSFDALAELIFKHGATFCDIVELEALRVVSKEAEKELNAINEQTETKTSIQEQEASMLKAAQEYCNVKNEHILEKTTTEKLETVYNNYINEDNLLQRLIKIYNNQNKTTTEVDETELVAPDQEIYDSCIKLDNLTYEK